MGHERMLFGETFVFHLGKGNWNEQLDCRYMSTWGQHFKPACRHMKKCVDETSTINKAQETAETAGR